MSKGQENFLETECKTSPTKSNDKSGSTNNSDSDMEYTNYAIDKPSCSAIVSSVTSQMRTKLPTLAEACDRTGVSDRSAAILVSAVLKDLGVISKEDSSKIVDRSKIRRERTQCRTNLKRKFNVTEPMVYGIFFDGRKDKTIVQEKKGEKFCRKTIVEEHIVLVSEPGSTYLGHVTPVSGSSNHIKASILSYLQQNVNLSKLWAVGCDDTVVNTGSKNGVRQLEIAVGRPLQWFICLLHANELPLRHLMQHLDGKTSGPRGYSGNIGKLLETCENLPLVDFEKIEVNLPVVDLKTLSTDQKYLYEICQGISLGNVSTSLSQREPGKMAHSRWVTTANRILRLYVSTISPSENLKILAQYVVKVYAPTWFEIKCHSSCGNGTTHLFGMIQKSRYLPIEFKKIIDPVIQRNGYFGHPENILLAMLTAVNTYVN